MKRAVIKKVAGRFLATVLCSVVVFSAAFTAAWIAFPFDADKLDIYAPNPAVYDFDRQHMLSVVSSDGQWSTPVGMADISPWLVKATIAAEDRRYYEHAGVDFLAIGRAAVQNIVQRRIVSGASTLTMQVCRMMDDRPRTLTGKGIEAFRALQLDRLKTKDEILEAYLNSAPYGGNVRGVEAAASTYFSTHAADLSLAEAALLAGLPKSPTRYNPRKYPERAAERRRIVLDRMLKAGLISQDEYHNAAESLVEVNHSPHDRHATHAAWMALKRRPLGGRTCIDLQLQNLVERLAGEHRTGLSDGTEMAVVVIDIKRAAIVALLGSGDLRDPVDGQVNGAVAKRSPGSALKPFIYAAAFEAGRLAPESTVYDVAVNLGGWQPSNFDRTFKGPVTAADALRESLNSPALQIANGVGLARCHGMLESVGMEISASASQRAGLAIAVGGVEVSLLELTNAYACLGDAGAFTRARLFADEGRETKTAIAANVCASVNDILSSKKRRPKGTEEYDPAEVPWFMWKTGTSSGRRDAWAVGHNGKFAAGVWVGRFRGTGRVDYTGREAAEPLLARLFALRRLRNDVLPGPYKPIAVTHPLPLPPKITSTLQIVDPSEGDTFIALAGTACIGPTTNTIEKLTWFLNGQLLTSEPTAKPLHLGPGRYRLHCLGATGQSDSVNFSVK